MKLGWYLARLRNMSAGEILHRFSEARHRKASRVTADWTPFVAGGTVAALPEFRAQLLATTTQHAAIADAAKSILAGQFSALGQQWPRRPLDDMFPTSLWTLSPESGKSWPDAQTYCFDIDFRRIDVVGDIKYAWEINRLQFLQPLAAHVAVTGDPVALAAIETAIASWHQANPPFGGIGWASGIEVALRTISLILTVAFCGALLSPAILAMISQILRASAFWLARFPSRFSSANNHLMAELAGLHLIALALDTDPRAVQAEVEREVLLQILSDGVGAEQTPTYSAFTAEMALLCALAAKRAGTPFRPETLDRLALFSDFIFWLAADDGQVASIGDDDEGRAITSCQHETTYAASIAVAICGMLNRPAPLPVPVELRHAIFPAPASLGVAPTGSRTFPVGGCSIWRQHHAGHDLHAIFDHGPLGYLAIAAHGHADALSLWLAVDGQPVFVDPGTFRYQGGAEWRSWFRSTRAHNTLTVNGADQSLISGAFNWSHKANARLDGQGDNPWRLSASHDGYQKRFGVRHQRIASSVPTGIALTDTLAGAIAPLQCELTFQLAADLQSHIEGRTVIITRSGQRIVLLHLPDGQIAIQRGGDAGQGSWVSPRFGEKLPADRIVWSGLVDAAGVVSIISFPSAS